MQGLWRGSVGSVPPVNLLHRPEKGPRREAAKLQVWTETCHGEGGVLVRFMEYWGCRREEGIARASV